MWTGEKEAVKQTEQSGLESSACQVQHPPAPLSMKPTPPPLPLTAAPTQPPVVQLQG